VRTIGIITRTHGFEGAVVVRSEGGITREPVQGEPVFVVIDGIPVPFFTREAYITSKDTLIISFDDYPTPVSVARLKGCEVRTGEQPGAQDELHDIKGFTIIDRKSGFRGVIASIEKNPGQMLAIVNTDQGEVLIPLHNDLIIIIDPDNMVIEMSLPEGLTGINF
jgi:16S rRNA processing protein RimM